MSILIHGIELPKKEGLIYHIRICSDGKVLGYYGNVIGQAVEIHPHGRLGDLDALERNLREMAGYKHGDRQQGILGCCNTICSAHTIIPASGGTDNG